MYWIIIQVANQDRWGRRGWGGSDIPAAAQFQKNKCCQEQDEKNDQQSRTGFQGFDHYSSIDVVPLPVN
jgi:hypothetical protein